MNTTPVNMTIFANHRRCTGCVSLFLVSLFLFLSLPLFAVSQVNDIIPSSALERERDALAAQQERKRIVAAGIAATTRTDFQYKYGRPEKQGTSVSTTRYDRAGNVTEVTEFNTVDGSIRSQKKFSYDGDGNCVEELLLQNNTIRKTSHRFGRHHLKEETVQYNADGTVDRKITYIYDPNGLLLEVTGRRSDGSTYLKESYFYTMEGQLAEMVSGTNKYDYQYDDRGNILRIEKYTRLFQTGDSVDFVLSDSYALEHDADGYLTSMAHYRSDSVRTVRIVYARDAEGRLVKEQEYGPGAAPVFQRTVVRRKDGTISEEYGFDRGRRFRTVYKYDAHGNTTQAISFDQLNEPSSVVRYSFGTYGRKPKEKDAGNVPNEKAALSAFPEDYYQFIGCRIIAPDGVYLGMAIADTVDPQSIVNVFGQYGSDRSESSIFNQSIPYGGSNGIFSPYNDMSPSPPALYKDGKFISYLTDNDNYRPRIAPSKLVDFLFKLSATHK